MLVDMWGGESVLRKSERFLQGERRQAAELARMGHNETLGYTEKIKRDAARINGGLRAKFAPVRCRAA